MNTQTLLEQARALEPEIVRIRRQLHQHPETGFDLTGTLAFVEAELRAIGLEPERCGRAGLVATVGRGEPVFLLRADMDALPVEEQAELPFAAANGKMHACGHDMHAAMLLGAAKLLKAHEDALCGTVKLDFQPAEELFEGARDMIAAGLLEHPKVDAALMIHVSAAMPMPAGTVIVCGGGVSAPAADCFTIRVQGKGCHGSMPDQGIDPISIAAHIVLALQEIHARELNLSDEAVLTIGSINGGIADNVIPDTVALSGTIRTYHEQTRQFIKERMAQIITHTAAAFRGEATLDFVRCCPTLENDAALSDCATRYAVELLGAERAFNAAQLVRPGTKPSKAGGSEDFAYVSHEVPSIMLALAAGEPDKGYCYPQHHPKVTFDESVLASGSAVYAYTAMRWLEEHQ